VLSFFNSDWCNWHSFIDVSCHVIACVWHNGVCRNANIVQRVEAQKQPSLELIARNCFKSFMYYAQIDWYSTNCISVCLFVRLFVCLFINALQKQKQFHKIRVHVKSIKRQRGLNGQRRAVPLTLHFCGESRTKKTTEVRRLDDVGAWSLKKVKFSHTRYRALGPELIPVYRQSARRWREVNHDIDPAVGCRYFLPGLRLPP